MFGNILVSISGITWTIVYIELIQKGFKEKACGMPLFALTLNLAWELIYAIDGLFISKSFILVQSIANVVWAFFDIFILITWLLLCSLLSTFLVLLLKLHQFIQPMHKMF